MTVLLGLLSGVLSYRTMFLGTSALLVISNLGYALAGAAQSKWLIFFSRIGLGLGAGTLSLVRAYFAECYDEVNRTTVLAVAAAVQYGGFALFPGLGDVLDILTARFGWNVDGAISSNTKVNLVMNEFTAPAWLMIFLNIASLVGLALAFVEPPYKPFEMADLVPFYHPFRRKIGTRAIGDSVLYAFGLSSHPSPLKDGPTAGTSQEKSLELVDMKKPANGKADAISSRAPSFELHSDGHITFVDGKEKDRGGGESGAGDEEANIGLTEDDNAESLEAIDQGGNGSDPDQPADKSQARLITIIWLAFLFINFLIRVVLGTVEVLGATLYDLVTQKYIPMGQDSFNPASGTFYTILGVVGVGVVVILAIFAKRIVDEIPFLISLVALLLGSLILIGSPEKMSLLQFTIGSGLMYSIGYPLAQSVVVSMFSKIPASKRNQAVSMSWIGSSGSIGRILGPIIVSAIFQRSGAPSTFIFNASISALLLLISVITIWYMKKIKKG